MWHYDSDSDIVTILYSWVRLSTTTTTSTAGLMFSKWRCNIQDLLQWIENYTFCWITTKSMFTLLSWISYSEFQTFCETISVVFHHPTIYIYTRYTALGWFEVFRYLWLPWKFKFCPYANYQRTWLPFKELKPRQ